MLENEDLSNPQDYPINFWKGIIYEKNGYNEQAIKTWAKIGYPNHLIYRVRIYNRLGMNNEAIFYSKMMFDVCKSGGCSNGKMGDIWGSLGDIYRKNGNHLEAASAYQKAVELHPLIEYREGLALSLWEIGDLQGAVNVFDKIIHSQYQYFPFLYPYYIWLGKLHEELGDISRAEQNILIGVQLVDSTTNDWPFQEAASFYARQKKFHKVDEIMSRIIAEYPENVCQNIQYWYRLMNEAGETSEKFTDISSDYQSVCPVFIIPE